MSIRQNLFPYGTTAAGVRVSFHNKESQYTVNPDVSWPICFTGCRQGDAMPSLCFLLLVTVCSIGIRSQQTPLNNLPACGLSCLLDTVPASGCSLTDNACQCSNPDLAITTAACLQANCTMQDTLDVARVQASVCQLPHTDRGRETLIIVFSMVAVAFTAYLLRMASKLTTHNLAVEDTVITTAVFLTPVPIVCVKYMVDLGFGKHLWDLKDGHLLKTLRLFYIAEVVYVAVLALTKASIILMYIHIFRSSITFRRWSYAVLSMLILSTIIITPLTIVSCRPVQFFWDRDIKGGTCLDINALAYAHSAIAIFFDIIIITMPIGMLWRLNMPTNRKFQIGIMFAIGGFGLIATVLRLQSLLVFGSSLDPTADYVPVVYWTTGELAAGIICSCLPAIRKLLDKSTRRLVDSVKLRSIKKTGLTPLSPSAASHGAHKLLSRDCSSGSKSAGTNGYEQMEDTSGSLRADGIDAESGSDQFLPIQGVYEPPDEVLRVTYWGERESDG
ncbi:integral membrane protein [Verticillium dahliae]|nr:integral membrane protein [Verticillium dahliae]